MAAAEMRRLFLLRKYEKSVWFDLDSDGENWYNNTTP